MHRVSWRRYANLRQRENHWTATCRASASTPATLSHRVGCGRAAQLFQKSYGLSPLVSFPCMDDMSPPFAYPAVGQSMTI